MVPCILQPETYIHANRNTGTVMQLLWLSLAIASTVAYHVIIKLMPAGANPVLSLMATYGSVALLLGGALLLAPGGGEFAWRDEVRQLNWTAVALGLAIIGLDLGFILLYRTGFEVSLGALVTQTAAAMLLVGIGVLVFREQLSLSNGFGIVLCLVGLWLVNRR
jgi:drug/metabolite transporter (DMT)-like permease